MEKEPIDLLIDNARFILTQDQNRTLLQGASIAVKGSRIAAIGDPQDLKTKYLPDSVVSGSERLVTPGLVNAHCHLESCFDKGLLDDCPLVAYIGRKYGFTWDQSY